MIAQRPASLPVGFHSSIETAPGADGRGLRSPFPEHGVFWLTGYPYQREGRRYINERADGVEVN